MWIKWPFEVPFIACTYVLRIAHLNYLKSTRSTHTNIIIIGEVRKYTLKKSETKKITIFLFG